MKKWYVITLLTIVYGPHDLSTQPLGSIVEEVAEENSARRRAPEDIVVNPAQGSAATVEGVNTQKFLEGLGPRKSKTSTQGLTVPETGLMKRGSVIGPAEQLSGIAQTTSGSLQLTPPSPAPQPLPSILPGHQADVQTQIRAQLRHMDTTVETSGSVLESSVKNAPESNAKTAQSSYAKYQSKEQRLSSQKKAIKDKMEKAGLYTIRELTPKQKTQLQNLLHEYKGVTETHLQRQAEVTKSIPHVDHPTFGGAQPFAPRESGQSAALKVPGSRTSLMGARRVSTSAVHMKQEPLGPMHIGTPVHHIPVK